MYGIRCVCMSMSTMACNILKCKSPAFYIHASARQLHWKCTVCMCVYREKGNQKKWEWVIISTKSCMKHLLYTDEHTLKAIHRQKKTYMKKKLYTFFSIHIIVGILLTLKCVWAFFVLFILVYGKVSCLNVSTIRRVYKCTKVYDFYKNSLSHTCVYIRTGFPTYTHTQKPIFSPIFFLTNVSFSKIIQFL